MKKTTVHFATTRRDCGACPRCGAKLDAQTSAPLYVKYLPADKRPKSIGHDWYPEPGAWSVCTSCATILMFDENTKLRLPLPHEFITLQGEHREFFLGLMDVKEMVEEKKGSDAPQWAKKFL